MSSNSARPLGLVLVAALAVSGCAAGIDRNAARGLAELPRTPTEQYKISTVDRPAELLLAPHDMGLSVNQRAALASYAEQWRETGSSDILIEASTVGGADAYRTSKGAADALVAEGVPSAAISIVGYEADPRAPIRISFFVPEKVAIDCNRSWDRLTATGSNRVPQNFGCAVTANRAAMIANAADIVRPRAEQPADATRRQTVLDKYRRGEVTSSAQDEQASGTVSRAVN